MYEQPVALVTGANRGIGLATADRLAEEGYRVLLGSRDAAAGEAATLSLGGDGRLVVPVRLDVADPASRGAVAGKLAADGVLLDLLVGNAGILPTQLDAATVRRTVEVNTFGAVGLADALMPVMKDGGAIVFVSSGMGSVGAYGAALRRRFLAPDIDRAAVAALVEEFVAAVENGTARQEGWPSDPSAAAYRVSKAALNALTRILAREVAPRGIRVNAVCPGWVRTDMGGPMATRGVEEGAASVVAPAFDPSRPTGGFFRDGRAIDW